MIDPDQDTANDPSNVLGARGKPQPQRDAAMAAVTREKKSRVKALLMSIVLTLDPRLDVLVARRHIFVPRILLPRLGPRGELPGWFSGWPHPRKTQPKPFRIACHHSTHRRHRLRAQTGYA